MSDQQIRLLVLGACDEEALQIASRFERAGYGVAHKRVASPAAVQAAVGGEAFDLVVSVGMAEVDVRAAMDSSAKCIALPFIIFSDEVTEESAAEAFRAGASDVLPTSMIERVVPIAERARRMAVIANEHRAMEFALAESEARSRTIASNIPGMVYQMILRQGGGFVFPYVSEGVYALLGVRPRTLQEHPSFFLDLIAPEDRLTFHSGMMKSAKTLTAWNWEGRVLIGDAREVKWVNLRASPRRIEDGGVQWEGIMWNITKSKRAEQEILESRQQLQALSSHLETVKEHERANIAREIHDDIGGTLTAIKIDVLWLANRLPAERSDLRAKVCSLENLVDHAMTTSTRIARDLRPSILDFGVVAAIEWQTEDFRKRLGIACDLSCAEGDIELDPDVAMALFRIFQETLTNISKHARATRVQVNIRTQDDWVVLRVADNGRGLARQDMLKPRSFGIRGMRERARYLGGDVEVQGAPREGTTVTVRIPVAATEAQNSGRHDQQALF